MRMCMRVLVWSVTARGVDYGTVKGQSRVLWNGQDTWYSTRMSLWWECTIARLWEMASRRDHQWNIWTEWMSVGERAGGQGTAYVQRECKNKNNWRFFCSGNPSEGDRVLEIHSCKSYVASQHLQQLLVDGMKVCHSLERSGKVHLIHEMQNLCVKLGHLSEHLCNVGYDRGRWWGVHIPASQTDRKTVLQCKWIR